MPVTGESMVRRRGWQATEARKRLGELMDKAHTEGLQIITRRGKEAVVVISYREFASLKKRQPRLLEFFRASPLVGVRLDLERDRTLPRGVGNYGVRAIQAGT